MSFRHNLNPIAIDFFGYPISWYWLFYPLSFFLVFFLAFRNRGAVPKNVFIDHAIVTWLTLFIGGRLGYVLIYNRAFFWENPEYIWQFWTGGMSFHGALIGVVIGNGIYSRFHDRGRSFLLKFSDAVCVQLPIALFLGRIGNFINGELWGRPFSGPWAMVFPRADDIPRHPSQLYEAFGEGVLLYGIMWWLSKSTNPPGKLTLLFAGYYSALRFLIEFFREPDVQLGYFVGFSMGQILCTVTLIFVTVLYRTNFVQLK